MKLLGIVLIVIGVIGLAYGGVSWTHREQVADIGPVTIDRQERESLPVPPIIGGISLLAGIALVLSGRGRRG